MHPNATGLAVWPISTAPGAFAGILVVGPAFAEGCGMLGSAGAGATAGDRQDPALCRAPKLHERSPAWAAWRNYSGSLLLGLLPQWAVRCQGFQAPSLWTPLARVLWDSSIHHMKTPETCVSISNLGIGLL